MPMVRSMSGGGAVTAHRRGGDLECGEGSPLLFKIAFGIAGKALRHAHCLSVSKRRSLAALQGGSLWCCFWKNSFPVGFHTDDGPASFGCLIESALEPADVGFAVVLPLALGIVVVDIDSES